MKVIKEAKLRSIIQEAVSSVLKTNLRLREAKKAFEEWCMDLNLDYIHKGDYIEDEEQSLGAGKQLMAAKYLVHFFADDYDLDEIKEAIYMIGENDCGFEISHLPHLKKKGENEYQFIIDIH